MSPPIETIGRTVTAVLWEKTGSNQYNEPVLTEPVEIMVRWEDRVEQGNDRFGRPVTFVANLVVAQTIPVGSLMTKGSLDDWYVSGSAGDQTKLLEVDQFLEIDDIKGRVVRRVARLCRFRRRPS